MSEATKQKRRIARIRNGKWARNMTDDEWDIYTAVCELKGLPMKPREGGQYEDPEPSNVVQLPGVNRGGVVPEGGGKAEDGDHRVRYRMKYAGRLGKRWSEIIQAVQNKEYTWDEFVSTLTPEELARGQLMDKNGGFTGRPPSYVPRQFHDACVRELLGRGRVLYKTNYVKAIEAMTEIATDENVKAADRFKAAQFVIERLEGKVPDKLEVAVSDPWQQIISGIVAEVDDEQIMNAQEYLNRMEDGAHGN